VKNCHRRRSAKGVSSSFLKTYFLTIVIDERLARSGVLIESITLNPFLSMISRATESASTRSRHLRVALNAKSGPATKTAVTPLHTTSIEWPTELGITMLQIFEDLKSSSLIDITFPGVANAGDSNKTKKEKAHIKISVFFMKTPTG
jgi:hypothetical protein